ncbi:MAG TPA: dienelactone hydrolase family protein [Myxococcales bacterium]|nr:dienelactone hydrolase family protein [Myxococcales bacterium]
MSRTEGQLKTADGTCPVSIFRPDRGGGPWPAVLFYMDGFGPRPGLFQMGERMAAHGYYVLLPDLFYRLGPYQTPPFDVFADPVKRQHWVGTYIASANQANVMRDTRAFLDFLSGQPDVKQPRVGTTGYCMGGGLSLSAAAFFPDRVVAAASYHGGRLATDAPDSPHLLAPKMTGARIYVAGAVEDASFTDEAKRKLEDALTRAGVDHTVVTYEGAYHGWVPPDSPVHHPEAAERHWATLFELWDGALKKA